MSNITNTLSTNKNKLPEKNRKGNLLVKISSFIQRHMFIEKPSIKKQRN